MCDYKLEECVTLHWQPWQWAPLTRPHKHPAVANHLRLSLLPHCSVFGQVLQAVAVTDVIAQMILGCLAIAFSSKQGWMDMDQNARLLPSYHFHLFLQRDFSDYVMEEETTKTKLIFVHVSPSSGLKQIKLS